MKRTAVAAIIAAALFSLSGVNAVAADLVNGNTGQTITTGRYVRWLDQSKIAKPDGTIQIYPDANAAILCQTSTASACSMPGTIWIGGWQWRAQFEHELGHQWDFQHMNPAVAALGVTQAQIPLEPWQQFFETMWGLTGDAWWATLPHTGGGSPGEWFATAYSACAITGPSLPHPLTMWEDDFAFPGYARPWAMGATCALIRDVNARPEWGDS